MLDGHTHVGMMLGLDGLGWMTSVGRGWLGSGYDGWLGWDGGRDGMRRRV